MAALRGPEGARGRGPNRWRPRFAGQRLVRALWRPVYEYTYLCIEVVAAMALMPVCQVRLKGPPPRLPKGGALLCPNHASYLDPLLLQMVIRRRITFVMTDDFYRRRWGRWFFGLVGAIPVNSRRLGWTGLRRAAAHLRAGHVVCVFPEGRISRTGRRGRAQRGVGLLARRTSVPAYPVGIVGSARAWPHGARRPHRAWVRIAVGPPLIWRGPSPAAGSDDLPSPSRVAEQDFGDRVMEGVERALVWVRTRNQDEFSLHRMAATSR